MYLKGLELKGFKSFSERTTIEFTKGITSIVGPNGSGKSNILDAILWVLGEQSYKSIRATASSDVIFSGGKNKRRSDSAEVSLFIENSDRYLDLESDEIVITRRVYRNGDGEYLINNKKARLKDIHNLFLDTGIGKQAYSIIGQGRVERIIGSNPKEIREILEEAAGTKRAKVEKEEANKRLENVRIELDKIVYVEEDLRKRVVRLKEESEKAGVYRNILRQIDIKTYMINEYMLNKLQEDRLKLEEDKRQIDDKKAQIQEKLDEENVKLKSIIQQRIELSQELDDAKIESNSIYTQLDEAKSTLSDFEKEKSNFEVQLSEKIKQKDKLLKSKQENEVKLSSKQKDIDELTDKYNKNLKIKSELEEKIEKINKQREELEAKITEKEKLLKDTEVENHRLNAEIENLERKIKLSNHNITNLEKEKKENMNILSKLELEFKGLKNIEEQKDKINKENLDKRAAITKEIGQIEVKIKQISNSQSSISYTLEQKKSIRNSMVRTLESNNLASKATQYILNKYREDENIIDSVANLLQIPKEYLAAISGLAGSNLNDIVIKSVDKVKVYIDDLKSSKTGVCSFLPLDSIKVGNMNNNLPKEKGVIDFARNLVKYDNSNNLSKLIEHIFSNALVVENIEIATKIMKNGYFDRIITLDGDIISGRGRVAGGYRKNGVDLTLQKKDELANLNKEIEKLEEELDVYKNKYEELSDERARQNELLNMDNNSEFNLELNDLKKQIISKQNEIDGINRKISTIGYEINDAKDLIISNQNLVDKHNETVKNNIEKLAIIYDEKEDLELEEAALENVEKYNKKLHNVLIDFAVVNEKLNSAKNEYDSVFSIQRGVLSDLEEIFEFENDKEHLFEKFNKNISEYETKVTDLSQKREDIIQKIKNYEKDKETLENDETNGVTYINNLEKEIIKNSNISEKIVENLTRNEKDTEVIKSKIEEISEIRESILTDELYYKLEEDQSAKLKKEIAELENKKNNIGSVNLSSIDQYELENERYTVLVNQRQDLENSRNQIKSLISNIESEMIDKFNKALKEIRSNFKYMCHEIFYGAKGDIKLVDEENILQSGLELNIKYKNKPEQSLTLLSGGEKSMLAVSFILAIFMYKPSPFTFFDEIEAALDEANTKKIIELLRRFIEKSQFILITHNKETMKGSDRLYGVTMQKDVGESRIVSVDMWEEK